MKKQKKQESKVPLKSNKSPSTLDTEINPGKAGNKTEVDLDKSKIKHYPNADDGEGLAVGIE